MKTARKSDLGQVIFLVVTTGIIFLSFLEASESQPQYYNRGVREYFVRNSKNKITAFPSKTLPRIGRRNGNYMGPMALEGRDPGSEDSSNLIGLQQSGNSNSNPLELPPMLGTTSPRMDSFERPKIFSLVKYLLKHGVIRPEDSSAYAPNDKAI